MKQNIIITKKKKSNDPLITKKKYQNGKMKKAVLNGSLKSFAK